jgi:hypothetical protein
MNTPSFEDVMNELSSPVGEALDTLKPLTDLIDDGDTETLAEITRLLQSFEHPGFTAHQVLYWHCNLNHGGQNSPAYSLLSTSPYKPSHNESPDSLMGVDYDFQQLYSLTESLAAQL